MVRETQNLPRTIVVEKFEFRDRLTRHKSGTNFGGMFILQKTFNGNFQVTTFPVGFFLLFKDTPLNSKKKKSTDVFHAIKRWIFIGYI